MPRTVVAITGASSGIGETFARRLGKDHDLIVIARRKDRLDALGRELGGGETRVEVIEADLTREEDVERVAARLAEEPNLGLLVNNAGFGLKGRFWEADLAGQEAMHKLHVMATVRLTHAALRNMVARDFGAIINVASVAAFIRGPGAASYSATKSWMTSFTEVLHLELKSARSAVVVQALCPGFTYSEFHDAMNVRRERIAPKAFWHSADEVVEASLDGLRQRKLFVIPGWRYRLLTSLVTRLPTSVRLFVEGRSRSARSTRQQMQGGPPQSRLHEGQPGADLQ
jgi:short-subunit dehydrogenase